LEWSTQGVFILFRFVTVREGSPRFPEQSRSPERKTPGRSRGQRSRTE
jgi:hypothetical protein